MVWYTLFLQADGTRLAPPSTVLEPGLPNAVVGVVETAQRPDEATAMWDPAQRLYVPRPPGARRVGSELEFRRRFTTPERRFLKRLTIDPTADLDVRAAILDAEDQLRAVPAVELDDPELPALVTAMIDLCVLGGVTAPEDRDARIAAIQQPWPAA